MTLITMKRLRSAVHAVVLALLVTGLGSGVRADIRLPGYYSDHMVFQQQMPIRIRGWADRNEPIIVALANETVRTTSDETGQWDVELPAMQASTVPLTLTVTGNTTVQLEDILIGEVWLCSGQSNMEWPVRASSDAEAEIAAADFPQIRHVKIPRRPSPVPLDDVQATWEVCSPDTVADFTACGYFMARRLHQELGVPVGLVNSSWGGTRIEPWTPPVGFERIEALADTYRSVIGRTPGTPQYREQLQKHIMAMEDWLTQARSAVRSAEPIEESPAYPEGLKPFRSHQDPAMLYNGMIRPLQGFPIRGAIWYQGESNHSEGMLYYEKKRALIAGWREVWGQGDFPFYYVQIAPFRYGQEDPTILAAFWEAQEAAEQIDQAEMIVINDIATLNDIHPPNKQDVGLRLANLALQNDYDRDDIVGSRPKMQSLQVHADRLVIEFRNTGGGLTTRDGNPPSHFEVIGPRSGGFRPATARIDGDRVVLTSADVPHPTAFRYAWHKLAEPNLTGGTGLPVGAFRGGEMPEFILTVPGADDYQLVYELDLARLGTDIRYEVDHHELVGEFDRIAWELELQPAGGKPQHVFVSVAAFTDDVTKIAIPTVKSGAHFQQRVDSLDIWSDVEGLTTGTGIATGNIEFWPNNYAGQNEADIPGASGTMYDFGDSPGPPVDGYGSMQVHNYGAGQTVFAINHWSEGERADIGIGNSTGQTRDWTFTGNAGSYAQKRLRVYVRPKP